MCCKVKRISVAYCQRMGRTFCNKTVFLCCMQEVFFTLQPHEGPNQHRLLNVSFVKEVENKFPNSYLEMRKHQQLCDKTCLARKHHRKVLPFLPVANLFLFDRKKKTGISSFVWNLQALYSVNNSEKNKKKTGNFAFLGRVFDINLQLRSENWNYLERQLCWNLN